MIIERNDVPFALFTVLLAESLQCRQARKALTPKLQWKGNWPDETFNGLTMSGC